MRIPMSQLPGGMRLTAKVAAAVRTASVVSAKVKATAGS